MGSGMARLLVFLLVLEGLAVAHQARDKPLGSRRLPGTESPRNPTSPLTHCDFDASEGPFCDWTQPKEDGGGGGEWLRGEGQAPGESPGPPGGSPERRGYYIYPEPGESVQLQSPDLNPTVSEVCVEFLYYMYSLSNKAQLAVKIQDTSGNNVTTVWTRTGMQSSAWLLGAVTVHNLVQQRPFKVVLSATQVETSSITIAVDNLSVGVGPCSPCVTGCDFDTLDDLCGWESVAVEDTEWEQWTGPGEQPGVGPEDDFSRPGFGYYMLLDSLAPTSPGTGLLRSPLYQSQGGCLALRFYYTLHGVSSDTALNVYAAAPGSSLDSPLLSLTGEHGPDWHLGAVNYTGTADVQFVFQGVYRGKPGLALDSVRISPCEGIFAQCDFNDDKDPFCGWIQPSDNATPWVRTNQPTPTEETGPPGDYPHGEGYYIYAEAGFLQPGQSIRLASRDFCTSTAACVEFYYSMSGIVETETQLRVLVEGPSGRAELLWARRGVQGPAWLFGSVTVPYGGPQPSKVIFEAVRGSSPYLDVALDNISVRRGSCAAVAPGTPAPPTGSSAATSVSPEPAITVSPGGPTAVSPTATSHRPTTVHSSRPTTASPQTSRVPRPTTMRATAPSQGFSTSAGHVVPDTSGPNPATFTQSVHTTVSSATTRGQATSPTTTTGSYASTGPTTSSQENSTSSSSQASSAKTTSHATPATVKTSTISTTAGRTSPATSTISTDHVHPTTTGHPGHTTSTNHTSTGLPSTTTGHVTSSLPGTTTAHTSSAISSPPTTSNSHASPSSNQSSTTHPGPTSGHSSPRETTTSSGASHSSSTVSPAATTSGHAAPSTANITAATRTSLTTAVHVSHTTPATITSTSHSRPTTATSSHSSTVTGQLSTTPPSPTWPASPQVSTTPRPANPTTNGSTMTSFYTDPSNTQSSPTTTAPSTASQTRPRTTSPTAAPSHSASLTTSVHVSLTTPVSHTTPATITSTSHSRPTTATSSHSSTVTGQLSTTPPSPTWPTSQASPQVSTTPRPANPTTNGSTMTSFYTDPSNTQSSPTTTAPSTASQTRPRTTSPTAAPSHSASLTTSVHVSLTTPVSHTTPATITSTSHSRPTTATSSHSSTVTGQLSTTPPSPTWPASPQVSTTPRPANPTTNGSTMTSFYTDPSNTQSSPTTTAPSTASQTRPRTTSPTAAPSHSTSTGHSKPSPTSFTTASPAKPTTTLASTSSQTRTSTAGLISPTSGHTSTSASATSSSQAGPSTTSPPSPTSSPISAAATTTLAASTGPPANTLVTSHTTSATTRPPAGSATTTPTITSVLLTTASGASTTVAKATSAPESSTATTRSPVLPSDRETCTISGDPHYTTFDGRLFHFMGTCTYLLSAVCSATPSLPTFRVEATNEHRGANTQVSYVKAVSVEVSETLIVLLKGRRVTVDGRHVALPVSVAGGQVSVRLSGTFVLVQTDFGLWVRFDGNHHAEVSAPSSYAGHLCGLCGNYNGQVSDDNLMPNGTSAGANADRLGESWQVPDAAGDTGCTNSGNPGECDKDVAAEAQKPTSCGILEDPQGPFAACHSKVPPAGAFQSCVYDLCGTGGDAGSLCFALQAYADRCAQAGVTVAWRNSSFCPLNCPAGSSYTPCGPPCPATCTDLAPPSSSSCPSLLCVEGCICEEGSVLSGDKCVPVGQCGCTDSSGQYHPVGDSWMGNSNCTERCVCAGLNNITCKEWSCSPVQKCQLSEGLLGCQDAGVAACHVAGDPHYFTFDSTMVSFMGTCTYTLVMVCHSDPNLPSFTITAKNEERGQPEASYLRLVTVEVAGATVTLQKSRRVLLDGQRVRTPIEGRIPGVSITTSGIYVVLETNFGLVVKFDGNHHLEIQLPGTYFGKVCGMCGNFNNQSQDDLLMPDGHLATNASQFGNSWKAPGDSDPGCQPDNREDLEPSCTPQEMEHLTALCREILAPKYQPCHSLIDPQLFLQNCLYDMCEYQGMVSVLCDNIQAYVEACKSQGVTGLSWRNSTFCPLPCPPHSHYSECTSPCPATCANLYAPASCQHPTTCVEGCACDRGYVLSDGSCVSMQNCGCLDSRRQEYYLPGDSWVTTDCLQRCTCLGNNGTIACQPFQCLPGSHCALSTSGVRYCRPAKFHQCVVSGDPHYRTFDAFVHHFQGRATYTLTRTLAELPGALEPLSVAGRNLRRFPFHRVSFLREVYVSVYGYRVTLMQGRKLVVNGVKVTPPYYPQDRLQISQRGRNLFLQTDFGFSVSFDGRDFAEIVLPSTYQNHVGGLCGNYDGQRNNEYMKPDGTWTRSLNTFGNSWQVSAQGAALGRKAGAGGHPRARREEPGEEAESGFEMGCSLEQLTSVNGTEACGALSDPQGPFAACHDTLSPDTFQESCVYDLCALFGDPQLLCQDYEAYAQLCQEEGVALGPWRQKTGCEISCPAHTTYQLCMTACPASCANMAAPSDCGAPCVEGCASDPGYILSGLESVPYNQCGCSSNDQYYQINDTFLTEDCSQRCTCRNTNTLECVKASCSDTQICTVANYTRGCYEEGPCLSSPCHNEGTCEETSGGFHCLCLEGYVGPLCEETPLDITPTSRPSENLTAILLGVLVPLGVILIGVTAGCIYHQKNKKKTQKEDYGAFLVPGQNRAPDTLGQKITHF